jgi:hypothetical protein
MKGNFKGGMCTFPLFFLETDVELILLMCRYIYSGTVSYFQRPMYLRIH